MKILARNSGLLAALALFFASAPAHSQSVNVDPKLGWQGWMNVFTLSWQYEWGSSWGLGDLRANFLPTALKLSPNINLWNPADPYWVNPNGTANKIVEANTYIDAPALNGNKVVFSGSVLDNQLAAGYQAMAVIKEFKPGYEWVGMTTTPLQGGAPFSVSRDIAPGNITQYGFMLTGLIADPATADSLGYITIAVVPEPGTLALLGLGALCAAWLRRK